jgi:predicted phage terminase large subunit-like protein
MVGDTSAVRHFMEANFIQDMHLRELQPLAQEKGRPLRLSGDTQVKGDKFQRVSSLQPLFENGFIKFSQSEKDDPDMLKFIDQLLGFEKGSNLNDDGPDALHGAISKIEEITVMSVPPIFTQKRVSRHAY